MHGLTSITALIMGDARERFRKFLPGRRIPLWLKILYTLWVALLVLDHWQSTPLSFLWFCNLALLTTLAALWLENSLLASMQAVAVIWWMFLWVLDFLVHLVTGINIGFPLGMANYMFDGSLSISSRCLSLYHAWLPFLLLWLLRRLGYDRRALLVQTCLAWVVFVLSYALTDGPKGPAWNLNLVYGLSEREAQTWIAPWLWLVLVMVAWPALVYVPSHFIFRWIFNPPPRTRPPEM